MDRAQLGRRLVHTHAVLQACDCTEKSATFIRTWSNCHRQNSPELRRTAGTRTLFDVKLKTLRHHADDGVLRVVEVDRLTHDPSLSAETALPQSVAEHGHRSLAAFVVIR